MSQRDKIKEELKKQEAEFYGDETVSGTNPDPESDDSVAEMMEDVMGEDASASVSDPQDDGFNIADEIEDDEEDLSDNPINGYHEAGSIAAPQSSTLLDDNENEE